MFYLKEVSWLVSLSYDNYFQLFIPRHISHQQAVTMILFHLPLKEFFLQAIVLPEKHLKINPVLLALNVPQ